jgi:hypothetical protein
LSKRKLESRHIQLFVTDTVECSREFFTRENLPASSSCAAGVAVQTPPYITSLAILRHHALEEPPGTCATYNSARCASMICLGVCERGEKRAFWPWKRAASISEQCVFIL